MRAAPDKISAPFFPAEAEWVNVAMLRLDQQDAHGAQVGRPTPEQPGAWSGSYEAGGVWAVLEPAGDEPGGVRANGRDIAVPHAGCYALVEHERHSAGVLALEVGAGVTCHAVQFTPGVLSHT